MLLFPWFKYCFSVRLLSNVLLELLRDTLKLLMYTIFYLHDKYKNNAFSKVSENISKDEFWNFFHVLRL